MIANQHTLHILLYLLPSMALALCIKALSGRIALFTVLTLAGTFCHELAHYLVGWITNARPVSLHLIPQRIDQHHYQMGAVRFANLRWYNAALTALAPVLILFIPLLYAHWRIQHYDGLTWGDAVAMLLLAPQFLCFWPSRTDWLMALRSWPYLLFVIPACWYIGQQHGLFAVVL